MVFNIKQNEIMQTNKSILIIGGYGVVGAQIAKIFNQRNPEIPLIIAGRNKYKAEKLASTLLNTNSLAIDVEKSEQLQSIKNDLAAVITVVNDPHNIILSDTLKYKIPYIDITRWTSRVREGIVRASFETNTESVVFASSWMAGVAATVIKKAAESFHSVDSIDIDILFSLKDKAGPNSIEYIDQLNTPFDVFENGKLKSVQPMTEPKTIDFPGGFTAKVFRFDTPDQMTLPIICKAKSVSARIGYDNNTSAVFLSFLVRSGIWGILNRPIFTKLRRSILYNPGKGGSHEIVINITGTDQNNTQISTVSTIVDKLGQTHLTAIGSIIQLERVLQLNGNTEKINGISYPENNAQLNIALDTLEVNGVKVLIRST